MCSVFLSRLAVMTVFVRSGASYFYKHRESLVETSRKSCDAGEANGAYVTRDSSTRHFPRERYARGNVPTLQHSRIAAGLIARARCAQLSELAIRHEQIFPAACVR